MCEDTSDVIAMEIASLIWLDTKHVMSHFLIHVWRGSAFFLPYNCIIYIDENRSQNSNVLLSVIDIPIEIQLPFHQGITVQGDHSNLHPISIFEPK